MGSTSGLSSPTLARRAAVAPRPHDSSAESEFRLSGVRPDSETWPSSRQGPSRPGPAGARCGAGSALQDSRLLNHAHKVRHRLFVDGRRLRLSRLLDFGQVAAGQDCQEAGCHGPSKRSSRREATVLASLRNHQRKGVQLSEPFSQSRRIGRLGWQSRPSCGRDFSGLGLRPRFAASQANDGILGPDSGSILRCPRYRSTQRLPALLSLSKGRLGAVHIRGRRA